MLVIFKSLHAWWFQSDSWRQISWSCDQWIFPANSCRLQVCRVSHSSFSKIQFKSTLVSYREKFEQFKLHRMKFPDPQLYCKLWPRDVCHHVTTFWIRRCVKRPEKSHLNLSLTCSSFVFYFLRRQKWTRICRDFILFSWWFYSLFFKSSSHSYIRYKLRWVDASRNTSHG